jgi:hypothetical protein
VVVSLSGSDFVVRLLAVLGVRISSQTGDERTGCGSFWAALVVSAGSGEGDWVEASLDDLRGFGSGRVVS